MTDFTGQADTKTTGDYTPLQRLYDRESIRTLPVVNLMIFEKIYWCEPGNLQPIREVYASRKLLHLLDRLLTNADDLDCWKRDSTVRRDRRRGKVK